MVITERARWGQLLLLVALLFGIATMHTVGHPTSGSAHGMAHGSGQSSEHRSGQSAGQGAGHTAGLAAGHTAESPPPTAPMASQDAPHGSTPYVSTQTPRQHADADAQPPATPTGMDPSSVCLAVLGAWGVALLAARLSARHRAGLRIAALGGLLLRALWPSPPPPRTVLATLSVLRI
ncbi:hypothetical protein AB0M39_03380 [Streptomyces sp. NPDC051907]|uniref:hypothetical protein n=1 Tax=Streptomyces sp. NPDC051907 TaxID=3155284 RepID=UPI003413872B